MNFADNAKLHKHKAYKIYISLFRILKNDEERSSEKIYGNNLMAEPDVESLIYIRTQRKNTPITSIICTCTKFIVLCTKFILFTKMFLWCINST